MRNSVGLAFRYDQLAGWPSAKTLPIGAAMFRSIVLLSFLALATGCSPEPAAPEIRTGSAWVRPALAAGAASAGYLTIQSRSGGDTLLGASSELATRVTLHSSTSENGIARMRALSDGLPIEEGETVKLEPGGNHLMLEQLKRPLKAGESISITLQFEQSGARRIVATVSNGPADSGHAGHGAH